MESKRIKIETEEEKPELPLLGSFLKFVNSDDFSSRLQIPSNFILQHGKNLLRSCLLRESGNPTTGWPVSIDVIGEHSFFVDGWSIFAQDIALKPGEYLHFNYLGNSRFEVSVYETTGCRRVCSCSVRHAGFNPRTSPKKTDNQHTKTKKVIKSCYTFSKKLSGFDIRTCLTLSKSFISEIGNKGNRAVDIIDRKRRVWPAMMKTYSTGYSILCEGWLDFVRANDVKINDEISCKFTPGRKSIMKIKVI